MTGDGIGVLMRTVGCAGAFFKGVSALVLISLWRIPWTKAQVAVTNLRVGAWPAFSHVGISPLDNA